MREICPSKAKASSESEPAKSRPQKCTRLEKGTKSKDGIDKTEEVASPAYPWAIPTTDSPITPLARTATTLSEAKRRKRNLSMSNRPAGPENNFTLIDAEKISSVANKRRRKSWTTLKKIAEASDHDSRGKFTNLTIPFCI